VRELAGYRADKQRENRPTFGTAGGVRPNTGAQGQEAQGVSSVWGKC